jgi:hypothetical protein
MRAMSWRSKRKSCSLALPLADYGMVPRQNAVIRVCFAVDFQYTIAYFPGACLALEPIQKTL